MLDRLPEYDRSILVGALARHRTDEKAQKVVARELSRFTRRVGGLREASEILHALSGVDWKMPIVKAIEAAATMDGEISAHAIRSLMTRIPGTAEARPQKFADEMRLLSENSRKLASAPVLAFPPTEIRMHSRYRFGGLGESTWPLPLARSDYPDPDRPLALLGPYLVDPHPDFWLHMPDDLVSIKVIRHVKPDPGREILEFGFANRSVLRIGMNDLFKAPMRDENSLPSFRRRGDNPHTSKLDLEEMLTVIRANISLLAKAGHDTLAETVVRRPRGVRSPPRPPRRRRTSVTMPSETAAPSNKLLAYHPFRFIQAYRETEFADAYDLNLISVFKKSPAQRVVPALGFEREEAERTEKRLVLLEACSLFWLRGGAHVIDLSQSEICIMTEPSGDTTLQPSSSGALHYVFLGDNGPSFDGGIIDGFYFGWSDGGDPGYTVVFTIRHEPELAVDGTAALARSLSRTASAFLPSGKSRASAKNEAPPLLAEAVGDAFVAINLATAGTTRTIRGIDCDPSHIPILYGRKAGNGRWLADNAPISTCYPYPDPNKRKPAAPESERPARARAETVDEMPDGCDGSTTFYMVESSPGTWKRLKKGDYSGANGKVVFPQFAGSRLKMLQTTAYLRGRKALAVASVQPSYLSFGADGGLTDAWHQWVHGTIFQLHRPDTATEQPWTVTKTDIDAVRAAIIRGGRSAALDPVYG